MVLHHLELIYPFIWLNNSLYLCIYNHQRQKNNPTIYNLLKLYSIYLDFITLFSYIILCTTSYLVLTFEISSRWPLRSHQWFISQWKSQNQTLGVKLGLRDSFWETAMFCNMCGITSYFPWQQNGQYFKQRGGEKILGILSDDFWFLLNNFLA